MCFVCVDLWMYVRTYDVCVVCMAFCSSKSLELPAKSWSYSGARTVYIVFSRTSIPKPASRPCQAAPMLERFEG